VEKKMNIIVLGGGLVGTPMAIDLSMDDRFEVTLADISRNVCERVSKNFPKIATIEKDLSDPKEVTDLVSAHDWVLNAVPGFLGFQTLKAAIEARKPVVDIAFFPEDPFELDALAKAKGVTAVVDCGVAPGMSNLLAGYAHDQLDETESVLIYVGGLPEVREWPYEYCAVFSPIDVIEEYTRPARYVENGALVVRPALSDPELLNFPGIGTLEAFNSDGLRSLARTLTAPNMKEKTLRYPGHIEKMAVLKETGFFSEEPIPVNGTEIRPIDFTAKILFPKWELKEGRSDITVMQVIVEGTAAGRRTRYVYDLFDRYDETTRTHSMARTTGYTATVVLRMLADGLYGEKGIVPLEFIGPNRACVYYVLEKLARRGVRFEERIERLD